MKKKILKGKRKNPNKNGMIGGHSPTINNTNLDYAVEIISTNSDGTTNVKWVTQFPDATLSKIKSKSTLFPDTWSDNEIIDVVQEVADKPAIAVRGRDGATLHREVVNGVQVEVIKLGNEVTSAYPTGTVLSESQVPDGF